MGQNMKQNKRNNQFFILGIMALFLLQAVSAFVPGSSLDATLLGQNPDPVEPGNFVDIRWKIENRGTTNFEDVAFLLEYDYPFQVDDPSNIVQKFGSLETTISGENSIILKWRFYVDENAQEGDYQFTLRYFIGESGVELGKYNIAVQSRQSLLAVEDITINP